MADQSDIVPVTAYITDTHIERGNISLVEDVFDQLLRYCVENRIWHVIHGGDWFQDRSALSLACVLAVKRIIEKFGKAGISLITIVGNHDKVGLDDETSYLSIYDHYAHFQVVPKSGYYLVPGCDNIMFYFLSYYKNPEIVLTELQQLSKWAKSHRGTYFNILCTHLSINGARNNDGSIVDGDNEAAFFRKFDAVLVGHYHDAQTIEPNIFYPGSGYQRNFGEKIKDKGFTIIYSDGTIGRVRTTFPAYRKIVINASNIAEANVELEKYVANQQAGKESNVRFVFKGTQEEIENLDVARFKEAGIDVKKESYETAVLFEDASEVQPVVYDKKNLIKGWMEYADKIGMEKMNALGGMKIIAKQNFN